MNNDDLAQFAATAMQKISADRGWDVQTLKLAQIAKLAEEVGEATKEANYLAGNSRHRELASNIHLAQELADVIITCFCLAHAFDVSIDFWMTKKIQHIIDRGGY